MPSNNHDSCVFVIFGASGDLTKRKLVPALYASYQQGLFPDGCAILGVSRTNISDDAFRASMADSITRFSERKIDLGNVHKFVQSVFYEPIDTADGEEYARLSSRLADLTSKRNIPRQYVFYLATPPSMYEVIASHLADKRLNEETEGWRRLVVEKPFGYDLSSARGLNQILTRFWNEDQIYRIDHYLGKETVQNVLAFRFSNEIFEPLWNNRYIHHVEIVSSESIGVENRGKYYDHAGLLRDMIQNHLMQVVAMIAMEPPARFNARFVRNETIKVFESLLPIRGKDVERYVIRGQYTGSTLRGESLSGYREEPDVDPESRTETFVAMKFCIENWRWSGVPFYIRAGKRLPTRVTEVVISFKPNAHRLFGTPKTITDANQLILRIQPDEGILMKVGMKLPGAGFNVKTVNMDFHYADLADVYVPAAYERLLADCITGDATLFTRSDAVEACWRFIDPILQEWKDNPSIKLHGYPAGTWGPKEVDHRSGLFTLFDNEFVPWRYPCKNLTDDGLYCEL